MTPEERARAVVVAWYRGPYNVHDWDEEKTSIEIRDIADAIRAAVLDERERCAAKLIAQADAIDVQPGESVTATWIARILRDQARALAER